MLKHLADMVVGEMISYVDTETGLANRDELRNAGSTCFDTAPERQHMEGNHFFALLDGDESLDDDLAIDRLCADTKNTLCGKEVRESVSVLVGRMQYGPKQHVSIDEVIHEADEMFVRARSRSSEAP